MQRQQKKKMATTPTHQPPPKRNKVSPEEEEQELKVSDLVPGDSSLVEKIIELAKSEEDPPLVFLNGTVHPSKHFGPRRLPTTPVLSSSAVVLRFQLMAGSICRSR
jgi:hypothetical protein